MKFSQRSTYLGLVLSSALILTACDKANDTDVDVEATQVAATDVSIPTSTETIVSESNELVTNNPVNTNAAVVDANTSNANTVATALAPSVMQTFTIPLITSGNLTPEQQTCIQNMDDSLSIKETQVLLMDTYDDDELEALAEVYSSDLMRRMNQFSQEQISMMTGKTVANPQPQPTPEEIQQITMMFDNNPKLHKFKEMSENADPNSNEFIAVLKPVMNSELKRCDIEATI